jgi:hypothetical protein
MAALATLLLSDQLAWALMVVQTACISLAEGYIASTGSPSSPLAQHCSAKSSGGEQTLSSTQSRRRGEDRDIGLFQKKGLDTPGTIMHAQSPVIDCAWPRRSPVGRVLPCACACACACARPGTVGRNFTTY